jgi:hypothetical protein
MGKKTPSRPQYEQLADTPWITRNRELNTNSYANLNTALDDFQNFNINNNDYYQSIADAYTNAQWNDLNRTYTQRANQLAARERQRLGTPGASSSAYNTDSLNRNYDYLASQVAANTANQYNNLVNQAYNRGLANIKLYNTLFNDSGTETQRVDENNWKIRLQNQQNKWLDEVDGANSGFDIGGAVSGAISGAGTGSAFGPWGAVAGAAIGGLSGGFGGSNQSSSTLGGQAGGFLNTLSNNVNSSRAANSIGSNIGANLANNYFGSSSGLNQSHLQNNIGNFDFVNDIWGSYA